jgi:hypothetical protein
MEATSTVQPPLEKQSTARTKKSKKDEEKYYKFRDKRKRDTRCISLGVRVVPTAQGELIMVGYSDNNVYGK